MCSRWNGEWNVCWNAGELSQIRQKVLAVGRGRSCACWIVWNYTIFDHILEEMEMIIII